MVRLGQCEGEESVGPGGRDVRAGPEVPTDMSWCNPVPVFVSSAPSLVTGHTVTMGQHMGDGTIGDQADTDHYPGTQELCATGQLLGDSPTLSKLGGGAEIGNGENLIVSFRED